MVSDIVTVKHLSWADIGEGYWYLATPYSKFPGGIETAFIAACKATARLVAAGVKVYSPISHTHPVAVHGGLDPYDHAIWMPADLPLMKGAYGLVVAMLPTWDSSYGISLEIEEFKKAGKPVLFIPAEELE